MDENQKTLEERIDEVLDSFGKDIFEDEEEIGQDGGTHTPEEPNQETGEEEIGDGDFDFSTYDGEEDEEELYDFESDIPEQPAEKTFTQSQVNDLVGNTRKEARDRALRELLEKYGVNDDSELDGVFGKGQAYDLLNDDYNNQYNELTAARTENALLKSKIVEDRWEDAKAILRSKGLEVTVDNILSEALTHPEWMGEAEEKKERKQIGKEELDELSKEDGFKKNEMEVNAMLNEKPAKISKIGVSSEGQDDASLDEKRKAMSLFGL
jgi:hypothetical protein